MLALPSTLVKSSMGSSLFDDDNSTSLITSSVNSTSEAPQTMALLDTDVDTNINQNQGGGTIPFEFHGQTMLLNMILVIFVILLVTLFLAKSKIQNLKKKLRALQGWNVTPNGNQPPMLPPGVAAQ